MLNISKYYPNTLGSPRPAVRSLSPLMQIAVLGGGLSGLSAAFSLSYRFPAAQILLFEKNNRLGGWAQSEHVNVQGRRILLEGGPRTLRPNGAAVLELVRLSSLAKNFILIVVDKKPWHRE